MRRHFPYTVTPSVIKDGTGRLLERVDDVNGEYVTTLLPDVGGHQDGPCTLESDEWCGRTEILAVTAAKGQCQ